MTAVASACKLLYVKKLIKAVPLPSQQVLYLRVDAETMKLVDEERARIAKATPGLQISRNAAAVALLHRGAKHRG